MSELAATELCASGPSDARNLQVWRTLMSWFAFVFRIFWEIVKGTPSLAQILSFLGVRHPLLCSSLAFKPLPADAPTDTPRPATAAQSAIMGKLMEKQRAKTKEKLDNCVKETLLELCDLLDLTVSKTNTKKDEIIVKLLDFMEAPHAMGDVKHAEKQSSKSRKKERALEVNASKGLGGNFEKKSRQKHDKTEGIPNSDVKSSHNTEDDDEVEDLKEEEDEDEDSEEQSQKEDKTRNHSKSDAEEKELEETGDESDEEEDESEVEADPRKGKKVNKSPKGKEKKDVKKSPRIQASSDTVKRKNGSNSKKNSPKTDGKSSLKTPPSEHSKAEKTNDTGEKALSREKKDAESPKKSNSKSNLKDKSSGKASKSKTKSGKVQKAGPSKAELLKSISEILKKVDFNSATFKDILELLASEYKIDLTPRKAAIKLMIQDELTKMVDEEEDEEEMQ